MILFSSKMVQLNNIPKLNWCMAKNRIISRSGVALINASTDAQVGNPFQCTFTNKFVWCKIFTPLSFCGWEVNVVQSSGLDWTKPIQIVKLPNNLQQRRYRWLSERCRRSNTPKRKPSKTTNSIRKRTPSAARRHPNRPPPSRNYSRYLQSASWSTTAHPYNTHYIRVACSVCWQNWFWERSTHIRGEYSSTKRLTSARRPLHIICFMLRIVRRVARHSFPDTYIRLVLGECARA